MKELLIVSLMLIGGLAIGADGEGSGTAELAEVPVSNAAKSAIEYSIPSSAIFCCNDGREAQRRYDESKRMWTADVYRVSGGHDVRQLDLITKQTPIHKFGGGSDKESSVLAIDVTLDQDVAIKKAILAGELFVIYYHYAW